MREGEKIKEKETERGKERKREKGYFREERIREKGIEIEIDCVCARA